MSSSVFEVDNNEREDWEIWRAEELQSQPFVENMILFVMPGNKAGPFAFDGFTTDISHDGTDKWDGSFDEYDSNGDFDGSFDRSLEKVEGTAFHVSTIEDVWAAKKLLARLKLTRKYYIYDFSGGTRCDVPSEPFSIAFMRRDGTYDQAEHAVIKFAA